MIGANFARQIFATIIHEVYLKACPEHISALQEEYGSTLNTSCVGAKTQHIFSNVQVNIATAELFDARECHRNIAFTLAQPPRVQWLT